jgi:hypothetical protein
MMQGSGSVQIFTDLDPGGQKIYASVTFSVNRYVYGSNACGSPSEYEEAFFGNAR